MTLVPLAPPPGLNSDDTTFSAKGRYADGNNVRFYGGKAQTIGAYDTAITLTAGQVIVDLAVVGSTTSSAAAYTVIGTTDKLWAGAALGASADKSPAGLGSGYNSWSFAPYGNTVMCSPRGGKIYQYTLGGGAAVVVTNAPLQNTALLVARRQVLAFGTNEEISTTFNGNCIRGSSIEDPTNWTTSSTNTAFEDILDDQGAITAAKVIGDYIAVWTTTSLWLGTFLGNPDQIYQWEKIAGGQGCTGVNAACVDGVVATWLAPDLQLWQWSPGGIPAPVPCPISKAFADNLFETTLVRVTPVPHFNEIWVFYNDSRDLSSRASRYIAFNQQGQWFRGNLPRYAAFANGLASGLVRASFDLTAAAAFLAAKDNVVYCHELGPEAGGTSPSWDITSADQYLDNGKRRVMIQRLVPDFEDQAGDIALSLYMRDRPQSTAVTKGPYTVTPTATKKDFRASGMIVDAKFSGTAYARFGTPCFETVAMGER